MVPGGLGERQSDSCGPFSSATPGDLVFSDSKGTARATGTSGWHQVLCQRGSGGGREARDSESRVKTSAGPGSATPACQENRPRSVSPTSACVFQKSASLELFTSQLMTSTSGRQRMFRVCTCGERGGRGNGSPWGGSERDLGHPPLPSCVPGGTSRTTELQQLPGGFSLLNPCPCERNSQSPGNTPGLPPGPGTESLASAQEVPR